MRRGFAEVVVLMALAWFALNLSLFGVGDRGDKYVQDVVNTHFSRLLYPYPPHSDITVLLLTDHTLNTEQLAGRWPASYDFHGRVLKAVLTEKPKALFIDFLWLSQRQKNPDGSYQDGNHLVRQLQKFKEAGIPVYLAGSPAAIDNWKDLEGLVHWVSVPLAFDVADFIARSYPPEANGMATAAFRIAQDLEKERFPETPTVPMDIFWSARVNEQNHVWMNPNEAPRQTSWADVLLKGHAGIAMDPPFNNTLFVRDLLNPVADTPKMAKEQLQRFLHNKIVLYGANLQGVNDLVFTPARSIQPGVYFHAMALDNLLNWGSEYKSEEGTGVHPLLTHTWISMLAVFPVVVISVMLHRLAKRTQCEPRPTTKLRRLVCWGRDHPLLSFILITTCLVAWFGSIALFEFSYLNYSASVVIGYVQVIVVGFFVERSSLVEKMFEYSEKSWRWLTGTPVATQQGERP